MNDKLGKVKKNLILQYSKLKGLPETEVISKLDNLDWTNEFKKVRKSFIFTKILLGLCAVLIVVISIVSIFNYIDEHTVVILFCVLIINIVRLQSINSKILSERRVLELLYEIDK